MTAPKDDALDAAVAAAEVPKRVAIEVALQGSTKERPRQAFMDVPLDYTEADAFRLIAAAIETFKQLDNQRRHVGLWTPGAPQQ